ncbi:MAG: response regulator [Ruminococcus sp.]|nr:response regulator [Ruminococcus sp.]
MNSIFADNSRKVKVAFFTDRPYFMSESDYGVKSGYAYDYYQMMSNYTGWTYQYVRGSYDNLYKKFLNGEIDIFPAVAKTSENEKLAHFSEQPMGSMICRLYTLKGNNEIIFNRPETFKGISVGITDNNVLYEYFVDFFKSKNINCNIVQYDTYAEKISGFENGEVDAIIDFEALASNKWNSVMMVDSYDYYLAVSKERTDLYKEVEEVLEIIYDREPYYNNVMYYEHYSKEGINKTVSEEEQHWISSNDEFTVGLVSSDAMTAEYGDQNQFIKTVISKMLYELDLSAINPVYVEYSDYDKLLEAVQSGEVDAAYPLNNDRNIAENFGYSVVETLEDTPMDMVTASNLKESEIKTIVVSDMKLFYYCLAHYPDADVTVLDSKKECLDKVADNKADATVMQCHLAGDDVEKISDYNQLIFKDSDSMGCALVVGKNQTALYSLMRRGISSLDFDYINHISKGTSYVDTEYSIEKFIDEYKWVVNAITTVFLLLVLILAYLISLRRRNVKKYKELAIYQCALYSQAVGYYQCNLTKDIMTTPYMKMIDGEPVDIIDYIPFVKDTSFSSLMDYIASHYVIMDANKFREFMNPEKLIRCYEEGDFKPEFSCWITVPAEGEKVFQRYIHFLSKNKAGEVTATCIVYDNSEHESELEKQRIKAESANIAKSTFLFNMTHDVRTPMNAIIGYTNMAEKNVGNDEKITECIKKIQHSSRQLLLILDDALDMSRVESGTIIVNEELVNIKENISRAKDVIIKNGEMNGVDVTFHIGNMDDYEIHVDSMLLNKILFNVVDNAIKYSKPGGKVKITISQKKLDKKDFARYNFVIQDNGIGMSPEFLGRIYEMFTRENSSTVSGIQGTGVGMAITKKLVDLMDGDIQIDSQKGVGTRVKLQFDFRVSEAKPQPENIEEECDFNGRRILLVEDIEINREIAREILEEQGIIVEEAVDGSVAVDMVSKSYAGYYDLVFMDIQMPVMDGYEATRRIRTLENSELANIPIVALTANALDEDVNDSLDAGMNAHLSKPIDLVEMNKVMCKYILNV